MFLAKRCLIRRFRFSSTKNRHKHSWHCSLTQKSSVYTRPTHPNTDRLPNHDGEDVRDELARAATVQGAGIRFVRGQKGALCLGEVGRFLHVPVGVLDHLGGEVDACRQGQDAAARIRLQIWQRDPVQG